MNTDIETALAFDDVLILPLEGKLKSRSNADISTRLCPGLELNVPIISSNMDTVTETDMAIAMARAGGLGIIHRFNTPEIQAKMVRKVKRAENYVIEKPYTTYEGESVRGVREAMEYLGVGSLIVTNSENICKGIVTSRDIRFQSDDLFVSDIMTPVSDMVYMPPGEKLQEYIDVFQQEKVKKLPLLNPMDFSLQGLVCAADILKREKYPNATRDNQGRLIVGAAIGFDEWDRVQMLVDAGVDTIVLDVAHGHCDKMVENIHAFKDRWPNVILGAGNVATGSGYLALANAGANWIKAGVGGGCFTEETKVLMADGTQRNINKVEEGEYVINKDGKPVKVIGVYNRGIKEVIRLKTNNWHEDIFVTPDHHFWIGNLSAIKNIRHVGSIAKNLDKRNKNKGHTSKYEWRPISNVNAENMFTLSPYNIQWNLPDEMTIDMSDYVTRGTVDTHTIKTVGSKNGPVEMNRNIKNSYGLGYLFGSFLGDGHAFLNTNGYSQIGNVQWYYGRHETDIVSKTVAFISSIFNLDSKTKTINNVTKITVYSKILAEFFKDFGKRDNKHLPKKYLCTDKEYIRGLYDGLIDSDGHTEYYKGSVSQKSFYNTSVQLTELFQWCCVNLNISFGTCKRPGSVGNLKNVNPDNLLDHYRVKTHTTNRFTKNYIYSCVTNYEEIGQRREVWDIEVDCPTHSFVANNNIVHNSICKTRIVSGSGVPTFQSVRWCKQVQIPDVGFVADGGIKTSGDIAKSIGAGANAVMLGSLLAGTEESPGKPIVKNGKKVKIIRGMAGIGANWDRKKNKDEIVPEGVEALVDFKGPVRPILGQLIGGLKSGMSYSGTTNLDDMRNNTVFIRQTGAGARESAPHDVKQI